METQSFRTEVPNLQDLMSDDLRWGWCKVHNKCNVLESSWNPTLLPKGYMEELSSLEAGPWFQKGWRPVI